MRKLLILFLMVGVLFFLFTSSVQAAPIITNFTDNNYYWGGYPGTGDSITDHPGAWTSQPLDVVGDNPDITGGSVTTDAGVLTDVSISYTSTHWETLLAGDLFLNLIEGSNDTTWDYVFSGGSVYSIAIGALKGDNDWAYENSQDPNRLDHPYALNEFVRSFFGVESGSYTQNMGEDFVPNANGLISFELSQGINTDGNDFIIGFGPECANDVIYEKVSPVPIPTSILLFGSGLVGLAGIRRKRR